MHSFPCSFNYHIALHTTFTTVMQNLSFLSIDVALQDLAAMSEANP